MSQFSTLYQHCSNFGVDIILWCLSIYFFSISNSTSSFYSRSCVQFLWLFLVSLSSYNTSWGPGCTTSTSHNILCPTTSDATTPGFLMLMYLMLILLSFQLLYYLLMLLQALTYIQTMLLLWSLLYPNSSSSPSGDDGSGLPGGGLSSGLVSFGPYVPLVAVMVVVAAMIIIPWLWWSLQLWFV